MNRRRARYLGYARDAVAYPAVGVCAAAGVGWAVGVGPGVGVLAASTLAAGVLTVAFLTGGSRGATGGRVGGERGSGTERRSGPEVRAALSDETPAPGAGRRARLLAFVAGLFVQSALVVLWLGGLFGG
ncbi:hypothetical protein [Candidatus Halobonum tyrrellensis]|uniref:Uncharacterized protein n=1 Tax=Candidatus Halobonum tyrrellensis G22 TaxID=1324957 RepID=V4HBX3_9EURY|nr:hypothetical protein [Candidatus Halobonum tyrrellensis]ESP87548.1 hypothetical protein K933_13786 [Candidatus Halobonum tyrrellensis G22]